MVLNMRCDSSCEKFLHPHVDTYLGLSISFMLLKIYIETTFLLYVGNYNEMAM